jgi:hypothetical protein
MKKIKVKKVEKILATATAIEYWMARDSPPVLAAGIPGAGSSPQAARL